MVGRALEFEAGKAAGLLVTKTPLPDSPFKTKRRPTPSGFKQAPLPTYTRRSTGTTAGQLDVQEQGEGGDGSRGQGYSFFQGSRRGTGYDYSFDIEPIIGGPKGRMGVPTPVEPKFGKSYIGYLADEKFGAKKYYDPVTGTIKSGFPGALKQVLPSPVGFFAGIGGPISQANLERIAAAARIDKDGYAVATLGGRTIGVSPGPFGGYVLSGMLPEGITDLQRRQITEKLLEISKTDAASGAYTPEGTGVMPEGVDPSNPTYAGQGQYYSGVGPRPDEGGRPGDPGYVSTPVTSSVSYAEPDPASESMGVGTAGTASSDYGGGSPLGTSRDPGYTGGFRATGGTVGFAEGGTTQKDPIQRTGFVKGPPQEYAKGTTVADTENLRVKEGSFVINAPTTEKLQEAGVLPKGNQKRKAANGGKMMEVALSKGEYVVEPKDVPKFGGYNFLEAVNDMGKPEVERRQAMNNGGEAGIDIPPLYRGFIQRPNFRSVPEGFVQQQKIDPGPVPPLKINNINIDDVQKVLTLVETRGYEDRNEGYFFTRSDKAGKESSAFGPLQITKKTLEAMKKDKFGQLDLEFKTNPDFKEYYDNLIIEGRNAVNVRKYGDIYEGPEGSSKRTNASEKEKAKYRGLGYGNIPLDEHKKYYPTLAALYMRYKAGMSKSEDDLVRRHFGNTASTKKYYAAKKELGIS